MALSGLAWAPPASCPQHERHVPEPPAQLRRGGGPPGSCSYKFASFAGSGVVLGRRRGGMDAGVAVAAAAAPTSALPFADDDASELRADFLRVLRSRRKTAEGPLLPLKHQDSGPLLPFGY